MEKSTNSLSVSIVTESSYIQCSQTSLKEQVGEREREGGREGGRLSRGEIIQNVTYPIFEVSIGSCFEE